MLILFGHFVIHFDKNRVKEGGGQNRVGASGVLGGGDGGHPAPSKSCNFRLKHGASMTFRNGKQPRRESFLGGISRGRPGGYPGGRPGPK